MEQTLFWGIFSSTLLVLGLCNNITMTQMPRGPTEAYNILYSRMGPDKLDSTLAKHRNYLQRLPYPHAVIDDLFPVEALRMVSEEIPDDPRTRVNGCVPGSKCFFQTEKKEWLKNGFDDENTFGPATMAVFNYLRSAKFITFLERLTNISDIIPDPHYFGSGIHQTVEKGYLNIHADFNRYPRYELHRRVNLLLYLNENWQEEWGGHVELWSRDMKHCMVRAAPDIGRLVIFSSTDFSYHGHPEPLASPPHRSRRSLALYYYTKHRPNADCVDGNCFTSHSTLYQSPPCSCREKSCQKFVQQE